MSLKTSRAAIALAVLAFVVSVLAEGHQAQTTRQRTHKGKARNWCVSFVSRILARAFALTPDGEPSGVRRPIPSLDAISSKRPTRARRIARHSKLVQADRHQLSRRPRAIRSSRNGHVGGVATERQNWENAASRRRAFAGAFTYLLPVRVPNSIVPEAEELISPIYALAAAPSRFVWTVTAQRIVLRTRSKDTATRRCRATRISATSVRLDDVDRRLVRSAS